MERNSFRITVHGIYVIIHEFGDTNCIIEYLTFELHEQAYGRKHEASYTDHFLAGCIGGIAQLIIGCPVDLVKVQLQSQLETSVIRGPIDCIKQIIQRKGLSGMYKGIVPQAWRCVLDLN
jgi:hypothetical protein